MTKPAKPDKSARKSAHHHKKNPSPQEINTLVALFAGGRYTEAATLAQTMTVRFPLHGFGWMMLGMAFSQLGRKSEALAPLQKAASLLPDDAVAFSNLGNTLKDLGRLDEAEATCRRALEIKPDYAGAHYNLGNILKDQGRLGEAEASYRRALQVKPDFVEAYINLGVTLGDMSRLDEAEASYRRALQIKPNFAMAHYNLANTLKGLRRLDEAEAIYRRALQVKPDYAEAHSNLGIVLREQGKLDEAVASYRRALSFNPDFADAYGNLGLVLSEQGKLSEALACFQQQVRLTPGNELAQHQIASLTGMNTERAPEQYVESVFDGYADKFDKHLLQVLKYETPEKLVALVTQHSTPPAEKWNVLDLGCGTGLAGIAIAPFTRQLVGVDLSAKMLEKAHARNIYQRLDRLDLLTMMRGEKASSYDVIVAADVFIYIGKLDEIISETKRLLSPGGVFAFSVEALDLLTNEVTNLGVQREYQLEISGRYSHSSSYITRLAAANGFLAKEMVTTQIRMERNKPVIGYLVLWKS